MRKKIVREQDAEDHFLRQREKEGNHTVGEDFARLLDIYRREVMIRNHMDCSAWAWEILKVLDDLWQRERLFKEFSVPTRRRIRMIHIWLSRNRVTTFDCVELWPIYWEEVSALLFFSTRPGIRDTLTALREEVWYG